LHRWRRSRSSRFCWDRLCSVTLPSETPSTVRLVS
jgi:hypothetical protein